MRAGPRFSVDRASMTIALPRMTRPEPSAAPAAASEPLRLLHHMARSGGTLISKCLGAMTGIVLLSEIHPLGTRQFNPLAQAHQWFGLLSADDLADIARSGRVDFADAVLLIRARAAERGQTLVIRDWTHLDFTGVPFVAEPAYRLLLAEVLGRRAPVRQLCTVRHPIDQWLSLARLALIQGRLDVDRYLLGYRRFAETAAAIGFIRYEDFTRAPDATLADLCERLDVPFDPGFHDRWRSYDRITGDVAGTRGGGEITPVPRRPVSAELLHAFERSPDYHPAIELLGYGHPV